MPKGYNGKVLRVDLTAGDINVSTLDANWYRAYIGGWGMIAHVLLTEVPAGCDPLGPDNRLIVAPGVMTGAPLGGAGRNAMGAKSPLTGGFGEADVGGFFGAFRAGPSGPSICGSRTTRSRSARPATCGVRRRPRPSD